MKRLTHLISSCALCAILASCGDHGHDHDDHDHPHDPKHEEGKEHDDDHDHEEESLGTFDIDGISVEAAQAHGGVEAGKESHLVIKLPYKDNGETVVRAWIGSSDRTLSSVGKGEYAASHNDYDIHAVAPEPLPAGSTWWLEIEKPDGTKAVGSFPFKD